MSITDDDLQYMADAMWKDALMPDFSALEAELNADIVPNSAKNQPRDIETDVSSGGQMSASVASSASKDVAIAPEARANKTTSKTTPCPPTKPPQANLDLSSPTASLLRTKKEHKIIRSMKGASQNDPVEDGLQVDSSSDDNAERISESADPYQLPISPTTSSHQHHENVSTRVKIVSPATEFSKSLSPPKRILLSERKPTKLQKRVAKRSFLDAPVTSGPEDAMRPEPHGHLSAARPVPSPTARLALSRKKEAKLPKNPQKPRKNRERSVPPRIIKTKETKPAPKPLAVEKVPVPSEAPVIITRNLRPRSNRIPIIISSDIETSYGDEDVCSDSGFAPDTGDSHLADTQVLPLVPETVKQKTPKEATEKAFEMSKGNSHQEKSHMAASRVGFGGLSNCVNATDKQKEKDKPDAPVQSVSTHSMNQKRGRQEVNSLGIDQPKKKHKHADLHICDPSVNTSPEGMRLIPLHKVQKSSIYASRPAQINDPFVESHSSGSSGNSLKTDFTARLLQSVMSLDLPATPALPDHAAAAASTVYINPSQITRFQHVPHDRTHDRTCGLAQSEAVTCEMMRCRARDTGEGTPKSSGQKSITSTWLDEADPYKETGQIMGYVCKTILRHLKTKEAAIEDVAVEYEQRGSAVLARMRGLHGQERGAIVRCFEYSRQRSLEVFETARHDMQLLLSKLECVDVVPAINDVFDDTIVSQLRVLQAEVV